MDDTRLNKQHILHKTVEVALFARGRFVVLLAICLICAICFRFYLPFSLSLAVAGAFVPFFFYKKNAKRAAAMCAMWMIGALVCSHALLPLEEAKTIREGVVELSAIVTAVDEEAGSVNLDSVVIDGVSRRGEVTYWLDEEEPVPEVYAQIHCTCNLHVKNVFGNVGGKYAVINNTRYNNWLYFTDAQDVKKEPAELSLLQRVRYESDTFFASLRVRIRSAVFDNVKDPSSAALCYGMLVGDSSFVEDETYGIYRDGGVLHLLAVSGLHVGAIAVVIGFLIGKLPLPRFLRVLLSVLIVGFYVMLCDLPVSAQRALVLFVITSFMPMLHRKADPLCSLAAAAIIILLCDPLAVFNIGFRLSFEATGAIVLLSRDMGKKLVDKLDEKKRRWAGRVRDFLAVTIAAQLGVLPCLLAVYGNAPLASFIINPIVVPFSGVLLGTSWLTVFADLLGFYPLFFGKVTTILFQAVTDFTQFANGILPQIVMPFYCSTWVRVVYFALLFVLSSFCLLYKKAKRIFSAMIACVLVIASIVGFVAEVKEESITLLDVGQGQCLLVELDGENILIDCGTSELGGISASKMASALVRCGAAHIDAIILSHNDSDHTNRVVELTKLLDVDEIICNHTYSAEFDDAESIVTIPEKSNLSALKEGTIQILAGSGAGENEDSYVIGIEQEALSILVMGDATKDSEERLLQNGLEEYDILVVGHHGSDSGSSKEFLEVCGAELAIISVGRNNFYGHPDEDVLRRLENANMSVYCTAVCGMIQIDENGNVFTYYADGYPFERGGQEN